MRHKFVHPFLAHPRNKSPQLPIRHTETLGSMCKFEVAVDDLLKNPKAVQLACGHRDCSGSVYSRSQTHL
jgi:hypothetical protein